MRRTRFTLLALTASAIAALGASALTSTTPSSVAGPGPAPIPPGVISTLDNGVPLDRAVERFAFAAEYISHPEHVRRSRDFGGFDWFLAPAREDGVCLIQVDTEQLGKLGCFGFGQVRSEGIWMAFAPSGTNASHDQLSVMVVPDGYTELSVVKGTANQVSSINRNTAFALHNDDVTLEFSGTNLPTITMVVTNRVRRALGDA